MLAGPCEFESSAQLKLSARKSSWCVFLSVSSGQWLLPSSWVIWHMTLLRLTPGVLSFFFDIGLFLCECIRLDFPARPGPQIMTRDRATWAKFSDSLSEN